MSYSISGVDITLTRGDTFIANVIPRDPQGFPAELYEGDTMRFAIKQSYNDRAPIFVKDIPIDTCQLIIEAADTANMNFGTYVYDIQLTRADGTVDTFIPKAKFKLTEEVY